MARLAAHEATGLLLLSMLDYLPSVRSATGLIPSSPGRQASLYVPCVVCHASGRVVGSQPCIRCRDAKRLGNPIKRPHHGCSSCSSCEGRGERRRRGGEEPHDYLRVSDEVHLLVPLSELEKQVAENTLSIAQERTRASRKDAEPPVDDLPWLIERERYRAAGSYAELDVALRWLASRYPLRYETLSHWLTSVDDPLWEWSPRALERVSETIILLGRRMPEPIRVPSWVARSNRRELFPWGVSEAAA